jgi:hypothetical protein
MKQIVGYGYHGPDTDPSNRERDIYGSIRSAWTGLDISGRGGHGGGGHGHGGGGRGWGGWGGGWGFSYPVYGYGYPYGYPYAPYSPYSMYAPYMYGGWPAIV